MGVVGMVVLIGPKAIVGEGKLTSTDGIYGVRVNHVIPSVTVEGLSVTRQ